MLRSRASRTADESKHAQILPGGASAANTRPAQRLQLHRAPPGIPRNQLFLCKATILRGFLVLALGVSLLYCLWQLYLIIRGASHLSISPKPHLGTVEAANPGNEDIRLAASHGILSTAPPIVSYSDTRPLENDWKVPSTLPVEVARRGGHTLSTRIRSWPPLVTAIPEYRPPPSSPYSSASPASVDAQFCRGQSPCQLLLPLWIGEQEPQASAHLLHIQELATALNRTLVLPNVGKGKIGACGRWDFDTYYDIGSIARPARDNSRSTAGTLMLMDDFKTWANVRSVEPLAQLIFVGEDRNGAVAAMRSGGIHPLFDNMPFDPQDPRLKNAHCLKTKLQRLRLDYVPPFSVAFSHASSSDSFIDAIREGIHAPSARLDHHDSSSLQQDLSRSLSTLTEAENSKSLEVLLVHWDPRHEVFSGSQAPIRQRLDHSPTLWKLARRLMPQTPYLVVHWQKDHVLSSVESDCAEALMDTLGILLADPTLGEGVESVWFTGDFLSATAAPSFGDQAHHDAIGIITSSFDSGGVLDKWELMSVSKSVEEMRRMEANEDDDEDVFGWNDSGDLLWEDPGVLSILNKMAAMEATLFVSPAKSCGKVGAFTNQIVDFRIRGRGRWLPRNVVEVFG